MTTSTDPRDDDWMAGSALVAALVVAVGVLLAALRGMRPVFDAWCGVAACVFAGLALHALAQALRDACARAWGAAARAGAVAASCLAAVLLAHAAGARPGHADRDPFDDGRPVVTTHVATGGRS